MILIGFLSDDQVYTDKLVHYFTTRHGTTVSTVCFSNTAILMEYLTSHRLDILLAEEYLLKREVFPQDSAVAYFLAGNSASPVDGTPTIFKYQNADQIYRAALQLCADKGMPEIDTGIAGIKSIPLLAVIGGAGGVGATSVAAACAKYYARKGLRCLYLNLEPLGCFEDLFSGEGKTTLSELLYAAKGGRSTLKVKLEGEVRQDRNGVYFYAQFREVLDFYSLGAVELNVLLRNMTDTGLFDVVVVDLGICGSELVETVLCAAKHVLALTDGSLEGNRKAERLLSMIKRLDEKLDIPSYLAKTLTVYNRFRDNSVSLENAYGTSRLGTLPYFVNATRGQIVEQLSWSEIFSSLI